MTVRGLEYEKHVLQRARRGGGTLLQVPGRVKAIQVLVLPVVSGLNRAACASVARAWNRPNAGNLLWMNCPGIDRLPPVDSSRQIVVSPGVHTLLARNPETYRR